MCGICGKINFDKNERVDISLINRMADSMAHRGPDDSGYYISNNVGLGFRRLSIIDLISGNQPISNEDNSIIIVFNGEIYNYREQRKILLEKGHKFKTNSDTEVILHLYEEYGVDCIKYLRGMFAFVIYDKNKNSLFGARDRVGIKPFFYSYDDKRFLFASEIKAILESKEVDKEIDYRGLDNYFAFITPCREKTIYKKISKLKAAHYFILDISKNNLIIKNYWNPFNDVVENYTEDEWCEIIREKFKETVNIHTVSDVPIGAFLSGGIDSGSVVANLALNGNGKIKTFSIGFDKADFSELKIAKQIAQKYNTEHFEIILEPDSIDLLSELVTVYDDPFADSSAIALFYISKFTKNFVKVALSGDGGDELFLGYEHYSYFNKIHHMNFFPGDLEGKLFANIYKALPLGARGKGLAYYLSQDKELAYAFSTHWLLPERKKLYNKDFKPLLDCYFSEMEKIEILKSLSGIKDIRRKIQITDILTTLPDDFLIKVDRASMRNSLEVRVPFLDHEFIELSLKIPEALKLKNNTTKYLLKKSMSHFLTDDVLSGVKKGFALPYVYWFRKELKKYIDEKLLDTHSPLYSFLNLNYVKRILSIHQSGKHDFSLKIWSLLFLNEWLIQKKISI